MMPLFHHGSCVEFMRVVSLVWPIIALDGLMERLHLSGFMPYDITDVGLSLACLDESHMDAEFHIREMQSADIPIVLHHRRSMFADMGDVIYSGDEATNVFDKWVTIQVAQGRYRGWFVETVENNVVAGGGIWLMEAVPLSMSDPPYRAHVMNIYTEPAYRRRGLARRIMRVIIEWCGGQGIKTITLNASDEGRSLYGSLGFLATNEMWLILP
ncbi:MAG: GNAT family N-acetyltransferase [Anaerolineae bacterium]|nr:GNAT family N-acetyltransferase [Anaerolineae bacterium]